MSVNRAGWFGETAENLLGEQLRREIEEIKQPPVTQTHRELLQADAFAKLEIGNALNRIADALETLAAHARPPL